MRKSFVSFAPLLGEEEILDLKPGRSKRTRQVRQSSLAAGEGGVADGSGAGGGRRADGGAQSAGAEEGSGHD